MLDVSMGMHYLAQQGLVHRVGISKSYIFITKTFQGTQYGYQLQKDLVMRRSTVLHGVTCCLLLLLQNLAARNIIVDQNEKCKITNFTYLTHNKDCTGADILSCDLPTMSRWMAPESIAKRTRHFSTASDVWCFGVIQWEMRNPNRDPYHVN